MGDFIRFKKRFLVLSNNRPLQNIFPEPARSAVRGTNSAGRFYTLGYFDET